MLQIFKHYVVCCDFIREWRLPPLYPLCSLINGEVHYRYKILFFSKMTIEQIKSFFGKFVNDTMFLSNVITNADLFYRDEYFHGEAMERFESYRKTDTHGLVDRIYSSVDDGKSLQYAFNVCKNELNTIDLPNYDYANFSKDFGHLPHFDEAVDIREVLLSVCYELRQQMISFCENNKLTVENPKFGFLVPLYFADEGIYIPERLEKYRSVLSTVAANRYFPKAVERGVIVPTPDGYRRGDGVTVAQLAYFLSGVYSHKLPGVALCALFGESSIRQSYYALIDNHGAKPRGSGVIDAIFA